jgi:lysocardiolipin and lysophospholipid acyltransferase
MIKYLERPTGIRGIFGKVRGAVIAAFLFATILTANAIQMLSLIIRPFSIRAFRAINCAVAGTWWSMSVVMGHLIYGIKGIYSGDDVPVKENAVVFANHQQMPDVLILLELAMAKRRIGDLKWIVKHALKYVPGMGWGLQFLDCLFLKRNWMSDKVLIEKTFSKFRREQIPLWLVSFPEGTRITDTKLIKSQEFSRRHGEVVLENVLFPRTKGFVASVEALRDHIHAVYDVTIGYPKGIPTLWDWIQGWTREFHIHIRRYPVASLPQTEDRLSGWMVDRFREKDALLKHFHERGYFPTSV